MKVRSSTWNGPYEFDTSITADLDGIPSIVIPIGHSSFTQAQADDIKAWLAWSYGISDYVKEVFAGAAVEFIARDEAGLASLGYRSGPNYFSTQYGKVWGIELRTYLYDNPDSYGPSGGKKGKVLQAIFHEFARIYDEQLRPGTLGNSRMALDVEQKLFASIGSLLDTQDREGAQYIIDSDATLLK